jgi:hypothetical protein
MADKKITALTERTDPTGTDQIEVESGAVNYRSTLNNLRKIIINAQTGTTYTLVIGDAGKLVSLTNANAITLTIPTNASVAFPIGTKIGLYQGGAGQVTVGGADVTIRSQDTALKMVGIYAGAVLIKLATDTWLLEGNVQA